MKAFENVRIDKKLVKLENVPLFLFKCLCSSYLEINIGLLYELPIKLAIL